MGFTFKSFVMKYLILYILFMLVPTITLAQELIVPDCQVKYVIKNALLEQAGNCAIWNLSEAELQEQPHKVVRSTCEQDTSVIFVREFDTNNLFKYSDGELRIAGLENNLTKITLEHMEIYSKRNMVYGDSICGDFKGYGIYSDKLNLNISGSYRTIVDGVGTIILPSNTRLEGIKRLKTRRVVNINKKQLEMIEYRWFTKEYLFPILEKINVSCNGKDLGNIAYYIPTSGLDKVDVVQGNLYAKRYKQRNGDEIVKSKQHNNDGVSYSIVGTPDDGSHCLSIDILHDNTKIAYHLYTLEGMSVFSSAGLSRSSGHYDEKLPRLRHGNYIFTIRINDTQYSYKIQL